MTTPSIIYLIVGIIYSMVVMRKHNVKTVFQLIKFTYLFCIAIIAWPLLIAVAIISALLIKNEY
jgi:hypothetical protein